MQLSPSSSCPPGYPANFPSTGNWTPVLGSNPPSPGVYAVSIPGVHPSACTTWFQANQACRLSGKRLVRNDEWQAAVDTAADIARESADIIMLEKSLLVLADGIAKGREVYGNIIKYIKMTASSNFGNVFSSSSVASCWRGRARRSRSSPARSSASTRPILAARPGRLPGLRSRSSPLAQ